MTEPTKKTSVLVRHLARDPQTRLMRRMRPTNQLDFLLDDGRRIRRKGARSTELDLGTVQRNLEKLCEGIELRFIEVRFPNEGPVLSSIELAVWAKGLIDQPESAKDSGQKEEPSAPPVDEPPPPPPSDPEPSEEPAEPTSEPEAEEEPESPAPDPEPASEPESSEQELEEDAEFVALAETVIPGGKYAGKTLEQLYDEDPDYYELAARNLSKYPEVVEAARRYAELVAEDEGEEG